MLYKNQVTVLKLLAKGYSNQEIAEETGFKFNTVKKYVYDLFKELDIESRSEFLGRFFDDAKFTKWFEKEVKPHLSPSVEKNTSED